MTTPDPGAPQEQPSWWSATPPTGRSDDTDVIPSGWQAPGDTLGQHCATPTATASHRRPVGLLVAAAVVLAAVAGLLGGAAGAWWQGRSGSGTNQAISLPTPVAGTTARAASSVAGIASAVLPSVVAIKVRGADGAGTGSGFVIRSDGYIVTNNHVVDEAGSGGDISVVFQDGSQAKAKIVGRDPSYDLAALKVSRTGLKTLTFGDSASVVVGDEVIAIGAPLGLQGTVTTGSSVRSTGRSLLAVATASLRSSTPSRRMQRSTRATPVARSSTCRAGSLP
jgi:putative serine protease PepD